MNFYFLICSERSGSNLITKMFDSHPDVCGPAPSHLIRILSQNLYRYGDISKDWNWDILVEDTADILNSQLGKWKIKLDKNTLLENVKNRSLPDLIKYIYSEEAIANGKNNVLIKENHAYLLAPFVLGSFENAKFVYLVRDPRDMALSWKKTDSVPGGIKKAVDIWKRDQLESIKFYGMLRHKKNIYLETYENLVSFSEKSLKNICEFLNLTFSEKMLDFHENSTTIKNAERISAWNNLKNPVLKENFNKYKTGLFTDEIMYVEAICRDEMEFLGYSFEYEKKSNIEVLTDKIKDDHEKLITKEEEDIRKDRISVINNVLSRKLYL